MSEDRAVRPDYFFAVVPAAALLRTAEGLFFVVTAVLGAGALAATGFVLRPLSACDWMNARSGDCSSSVTGGTSSPESSLWMYRSIALVIDGTSGVGAMTLTVSPSPTAALAVPCPNVAIRGDPFGRGKAPSNEVISDGL